MSETDFDAYLLELGLSERLADGSIRTIEKPQGVLDYLMLT